MSDFGKLVDPMADAIFHLTLFLVFLDLNPSNASTIKKPKT